MQVLCSNVKFGTNLQQIWEMFHLICQVSVDPATLLNFIMARHCGPPDMVIWQD